MGAGPATTADARQNFNMIQQNYLNAMQQEAQGTLANAQQFADWNNKVLETANTQNKLNTNVANENRSADAQEAAGEITQDAATHQTISQNNHAWLQQENQRVADLLTQKSNLESALAQNDAIQKSSRAYDA